jgi:hypothetical protein
LGTQVRTKPRLLLSRRAFAKRRGVTEAAIRKRIADGSLVPAIAPDGRIDVLEAERILAQKTTAGDKLAEARRRKLTAQVRILHDELDALSGSVVEPADVTLCVVETSRFIAQRLLRVAPDAAPRVAGLQASMAADALRDVLYAAMDEVASAEIQATAREPAPKRPVYARMNAVDLASSKANLEADRLEISRAIEHGELISVETLTDEFVRRALNVRANLLALPSKVAPLLQVAANREAAHTIIEDELRHALAEFACQHISADELLGAPTERTTE